MKLVQHEHSLLLFEEEALAARERDLNVRERRIREESVKLSQHRFRLFLDSLPGLIGSLDGQQRFRFCNRYFAEFFGISSTNISGKWMWEVIGEPDYDAIRPHIVRALQGEELSIETSLEKKPEHYFHCKLIPDRVGTHGGLDGFFLFLLDITDRKAAEEKLRRVAEERLDLLEQANQASHLKDQFLAIISHELRTPLTSIVGWARLINEREVAPEQMSVATMTIERNARMQAQLIEELLDLSRIVAGRLTLELGLVDMVQLVRDTIDTMRPRLNEKDVKLDLELSNERELISIDAGRIQQVLNNLLSNALKFSQPGGHIKMGVSSTNSYVQVMISDTGEGISPAFLPHVFEEFRQADMSSSRSTGGLGLGLAIVRRLVELHGGTVSAASAGLGRGATFVVNLPKQGQLPAGLDRTA